MPESVLNIDGELSIGNLDALQRRLQEFVAGDAGASLDLGAVEACDAAGLQLICSLARTCAARGRELRIAALSPAIVETAAALGVALEEVRGAAV